MIENKVELSKVKQVLTEVLTCEPSTKTSSLNDTLMSIKEMLESSPMITQMRRNQLVNWEQELEGHTKSSQTKKHYRLRILKYINYTTGRQEDWRQAEPKDVEKYIRNELISKKKSKQVIQINVAALNFLFNHAMNKFRVNRPSGGTTGAVRTHRSYTIKLFKKIIDIVKGTELELIVFMLFEMAARV